MSTWYEDFYAVIDSMDSAAMRPMLTDDSTVTMANHPQAVGPDAVLGGLDAFWTTIKGMSHHFKRVVEDGDTAVLEAEVTYTMLDDREVTLPVTTWVQRRDGLIADQRIYIDMGPMH